MFYFICHISIFIFKVTNCDLKGLFYGYLDGIITEFSDNHGF